VGVSRLPSKKVDIKGLRLAAMHKLKVSEVCWRSSSSQKLKVS
jgi:hypothetical protein